MRLCEVDGCNEKHVSKGYCRTHYYRFKRYGNPLEVKEVQSKNGDGSCKVSGCAKVHQGHGYCKMHLYRFQKYGDALKVQTFPEYCKVKDCGEKHYGKGYCSLHHTRWKTHGDPSVVMIKRNHPCSIDGCDNKNRRYGYCKEHQKHSELYRVRHRFYSSTRRMRQANSLVNDFTVDDWTDLLKEFNHRCAYCGKQKEYLEHDHVVPVSKSGSHTINNIVPACRGCNRSKRARYIEEWYPFQTFYNVERELKIYKWLDYNVEDNGIQLELF